MTNDITNFKVRSILSNQILEWTLLGSLKTGVPEIDSKLKSSVEEFELLDTDENVQQKPGDESGNKMDEEIEQQDLLRLGEVGKIRSVNTRRSCRNVENLPNPSALSLPDSSELSQILMTKALGQLLLRSGVDVLKSEQIMEVLSDVTLQFLNFFGKLVRRELDTPGKVGIDQSPKTSVFNALDASFGNGIYDVVDYALELNNPALNNWSTQFQHLIPYKPNRRVSRGINDSIPDEDLPPRQWAVYNNLVPYAKMNMHAIKNQLFYYDTDMTHNAV
jgi:hypothetical protein